MKEFDNQYTAGFSTVVDSEDFEPGLNEDVVKRLSALKNEPEWVTEYRLKAWNHLQKIKEPTWYEKMMPKTTNWNNEKIKKVVGDLNFDEATKLKI